MTEAVKDRVRDAGSRVRKAGRTAREATSTGREGAIKVKEAVMPFVDTVVDALGGWDTLDKAVKDHNPTLAEFAKDSFYSRYFHSPAKFLLMMILLGMLQTILPIFAWPLDWLARLLGFLLLFNNGPTLLKAGFESSRSPPKVKSLLSTFIISTVLTLIPAFMFDPASHLGSLWCFFLPALLFVTPTKGGPTIAVMICDTVFAQIGNVIEDLIPDVFLGKEGRTMNMICGSVIAGLFWIGYLGATGSYIAVWVVLAFHTIQAIGAPIVNKERHPTEYKEQQNIWHNLLSIWLWRYLFTAIEGVSVPGVVSAMGLITFYLPSYFLWVTALMFGMLMTSKVSEDRKAATWYAKWLMGVFGKKKERRRETEERSSSGSSRSREESRSSRSSGEKKRSSIPRS